MKKEKLTGILLLLIFICAAGIIYSFDLEDKSPEVIESSKEESGSVQESSSAALSVPDTESAYIYVYVCGHVKKPDVYRLPAGSRVFEAIQAASGLTKDGDTEGLSMAGPVSDGDRIYVPSHEEAVSSGAQAGSSAQAGAPQGTGSAALSPSAQTVNINTADASQLQTLPGIGESKAADIIAYRQANGAFSKKEDLMKIPGIKEGVFRRIEAYITVQ